MTKKMFLSLFLMFLFVFSASMVHAGSTATWYMRSDTQTRYEISGYKLSQTQSSTSTSDSRVAVSDNSSYGVRVWDVDWNGTQTELTSGSPIAVVTRTANGQGLQNASWAYSSSTILGVLKIIVYHRFDNGEWLARATFITYDPTSVKSPTFTFYYYTSYWTTTSYFRWGNTTYNSRAAITYTEPNAWELMLQRISRGDLIGWIAFPYVNLLGSLAYGLCLFGLGLTLYARYEKIVPIAIIFMLFGGAGGVVTSLIPAVGLHLGWVLFAFSLAILFFKLVKGIA